MSVDNGDLQISGKNFENKSIFDDKFLKTVSFEVEFKLSGTVTHV